MCKLCLIYAFITHYAVGIYFYAADAALLSQSDHGTGSCKTKARGAVSISLPDKRVQKILRTAHAEPTQELSRAVKPGGSQFYRMEPERNAP